MKEYIKAEWELCKKNTAIIIIALCVLFLFALLLLFSGVGGVYYSAMITFVGYMDFLFFIIALYLSPASFWRNRQKVAIPSEQLLLTLGESKRTYVKIRLLAFFSLYLAMILLVVIMQIPAYLIGRERYSFWCFVTEVVVLTVLAFLTTPVLYIFPARWLPLALPGWTGFCGGLAGGFLGDLHDLEEVEKTFGKFWMLGVIAGAVGLFSMAYRYIKTIKEERGKVAR